MWGRTSIEEKSFLKDTE